MTCLAPMDMSPGTANGEGNKAVASGVGATATCGGVGVDCALATRGKVIAVVRSRANVPLTIRDGSEVLMTKCKTE